MKSFFIGVGIILLSPLLIIFIGLALIVQAPWKLGEFVRAAWREVDDGR